MSYENYTESINDTRYIHNQLEDYVHINEIPVLDDMAEALRDIVKSLYSKDELDIAKLDDNISWLASELGVEMPIGQPKVQRIKERPYLFDLAASTLEEIA